MKPSKALELYRDEILEILTKRGFKNPRVFGSVSREEDQEGSDLDLLVDASSITTLLDLSGACLDIQDLMGVEINILTIGGGPKILSSAYS